MHRGGADVVNELLVRELDQQLDRVGILLSDVRISHLAYAQEIAGAMSQCRQATSIVAARKQIVEGVVGMVDMALQLLNDKSIVELDTERKAAMVSNLLVVHCSDRSVNLVVYAGTLYHSQGV
jgi:regulator of protease activity HflC (stomatin/prohibitin superfamily)